MRNAFLCSLCRNGILGGALYLEPDTITYKTQKLTVAEPYRNLVLPRSGIQSLTWKWVVFPVATFCMKTGERYTFILFNKWRFDKSYRQCGTEPEQ